MYFAYMYSMSQNSLVRFMTVAVPGRKAVVLHSTPAFPWLDHEVLSYVHCQ